jgi:hypothetical protein
MSKDRCSNCSREMAPEEEICSHCGHLKRVKDDLPLMMFAILGVPSALIGGCGLMMMVEETDRGMTYRWGWPFVAVCVPVFVLTLGLLIWSRRKR